MYHIDYRPQEWDDVVGNETQVKMFRTNIEEKKSRVFMLVGPPGVGKTTLARIAAQKIGADPLSITEINGSDKTGVDDARSLIQEIQYTAPVGKYKVYIVDEVDKTTASWQSAMKKPLEDVPEHVYFFLCTTEPKKIIKDIHSRSTTVTFRLVDDQGVRLVLRRVIQAEGLEIDFNTVDQIISASEGSPRQALIYLENVKDLTEQEALEVLQTGVTEVEIRELCRLLLAESPWSEVARCLKDIKYDPENVRRAVLGYMSAVTLNASPQMKRSADILDVFSDSLYSSGKPGLVRMCFELS